MKLTSPSVIKDIMQKSGLKFNKSLGQNFLTDESVLVEIVEGAGITEDSAVIEIGPGIGCLTQALAEKAGKVLCIELDRNLIHLLNTLFVAYPNVEIMEGDVLKVDLNRITASLAPMNISVVANLPYYITTPILMRLLEENLPLSSITVMVQKEVADRMVALPGSKDYGALSVAVQYHATAELICNVPAESFLPPPKVNSAVVKMVLGEKRVMVDEKKFFRIVKASFGQRRKTLLNALEGSGYYKMSKMQMKQELELFGWDERIRGEMLSLEDFARLCEVIY